jgi:glycosyltransferase involved in cell wall biosynthesis
MMRNVLHIMDYAAPYKGNFINSIEILENKLVQSEIRLIYMFPSQASNFDWVIQLKKEGKPVFFIDRSFFSKRILWGNIKFLLKVIKEEQVDIIHTNFVAHNYSLFLIKNIFNRKVKIIGQFQNHYLLPNNVYRNFKIFVTRNTFDKIIGVSDSVEQSILDVSVPQTKVICIFNSLAYKRLIKYEEISLKKRPNQKTILMFGWPYYRKGVDLALEIITQLNDAGQDILLAISLPGGKEIIENEIQKKIGEIPSWVQLLDAREDVATYYNAVDIFISPSREEGYTFAVLEAAYCNCMIVVSTIGGNPQDIPYSGKFESEKPDKLKEAVIEMLEKNPEEREVINRAQKEYVLKTYDINKWANDIIKIYSLF